MKRLLPRIPIDRLRRPERVAVAASDRAVAAAIVRRVLRGGMAAARREALRFGDIVRGEEPILGPTSLRAALDRIDRRDRAALRRAAVRIRRFAEAQRSLLRPLSCRVGGLVVGHRVEPLAAAGCYAPGGRHPLPSSVLMTAIPARVAGVPSVWVASPRPTDATLAAAALAGADGVLAIGGAQAIALLARGHDAMPPAAIVVGPGNRFVTAAKAVLREEGRCAIDGLAGPSELLVVADASADPDPIAADLLAQAEHDPSSVVWLISLDAGLLERVDVALGRALRDLPTAATARAALLRGGAALATSEAEALAAVERLAPEHLAIAMRRRAAFARRCRNFGAVFVGEGAAEAFGDYGAGPNHTLPTGGTARFSAGLSVLDFLRLRSVVSGRADASIVADTMRLARMEGLEAHARSAELRRRREKEAPR
jgi:phosphoribosyl-ATP pyrophosphohydrolase/phosphoribosyl-AMP cyclohydrolase/histidinol dehydrogenase